MAGGGGGMGRGGMGGGVQTPPGFNQPQPIGGGQPSQPMGGGFGQQPMGGFNQQGFQQPQGPSTSRMQEARMQQRFGQQGGMNQSPQMGGFSGGMGVGSSPYSPMGGGYGMGGANPQMDGMGGFGGGQGPQMGGFGQMSPMGGMGQPPMEQAAIQQYRQQMGMGQPRMNQTGVRGIMDLMRSRFSQQGRM